MLHSRSVLRLIVAGHVLTFFSSQLESTPDKVPQVLLWCKGCQVTGQVTLTK